METEGRFLVKRDEETNAIVPIAQVYSDGITDKVIYQNKLYIRDKATNALIPVVYVEGGGGGGSNTIYIKDGEPFPETAEPGTILVVTDSNGDILRTYEWDGFIWMQSSSKYNIIYEYNGEINENLLNSLKFHKTNAGILYGELPEKDDLTEEDYIYAEINAKKLLSMSDRYAIESININQQGGEDITLSNFICRAFNFTQAYGSDGQQETIPNFTLKDIGVDQINNLSITNVNNVIIDNVNSKFRPNENYYELAFAVCNADIKNTPLNRLQLGILNNLQSPSIINVENCPTMDGSGLFFSIMSGRNNDGLEINITDTDIYNLIFTYAGSITKLNVSFDPGILYRITISNSIITQNALDQLTSALLLNSYYDQSPVFTYKNNSDAVLAQEIIDQLQAANINVVIS